MLCILLDPGLEGCRRACLRPLTGADEAAAEVGAIVLLDRLLVAGGGDAIRPGDAARLAVADRDRLLAAVQRDLFGDRVEADALCRHCARPFAVAFSLTAMVDGQRAPRPDVVEGPDAAGWYRLGATVFRLPTSEDLAAVSGVPADERRGALLARCIRAGSEVGREDEIEAAMAALGPVLDLDLDATCPHCATRQDVRFAIERYLLASLANERRFVVREVHRIAAAYGWSYDAIMALPRRDRQDYVRLIQAELGERRAGRMAIA